MSLIWIVALVSWAFVFWLAHRNARLQRELAVALLRASKVPLFGRELVAMSGGVLRPGSVYVTLHRLEDDELVVSDVSLGDPYGRRIYTTTERAAELHRDRLRLLDTTVLQELGRRRTGRKIVATGTTWSTGDPTPSPGVLVQQDGTFHVEPEGRTNDAQ